MGLPSAGAVTVSPVGGGQAEMNLAVNSNWAAALGITGMSASAAAAQVNAVLANADSTTAAAIRDYAHEANIPGFASGTSYVPYDMMANIHEGEEITPRPFVDMQREARDETNALLARLVQCTDAQAIDIAQIKETNKRMFQIEDQWNIDGLPATRV
jgi:hypothetical protein